MWRRWKTKCHTMFTCSIGADAFEAEAQWEFITRHRSPLFSPRLPLFSPWLPSFSPWLPNLLPLSPRLPSSPPITSLTLSSSLPNRCHSFYHRNRICTSMYPPPAFRYPPVLTWPRKGARSSTSSSSSWPFVEKRRLVLWLFILLFVVLLLLTASRIPCSWSGEARRPSSFPSEFPSCRKIFF